MAVFFIIYLNIHLSCTAFGLILKFTHLYVLADNIIHNRVWNSAPSPLFERCSSSHSSLLFLLKDVSIINANNTLQLSVHHKVVNKIDEITCISTQIGFFKQLVILRSNDHLERIIHNPHDCTEHKKIIHTSVG